jgi:hypothetical protein
MWNRRLNKLLLCALAISLAVHVLLIARSAGWWSLPASADGHIVVELASPSAPQPAAVESKPLPVAKPARKVSTPKPKAPPQPEPPVQPAPVEDIPVAVAEPTPEPEPIAETGASEEETPQVAAAPVAVEEDPVVQEEEEQVPAPPHHVVIEFNILRKGGVVGTERHVYDANEQGYTLTSVAKPRGLYALALSELVQKSEGRVAPQGLKPERFSYQYGSKSDKTQLAVFDWEQGKLSMQAGSRKQEVPLSEGAQDLMSFMYQFMFVPPLQEMQLAITNGKRFRTYDYGFEGEETIDTPLGKVNCIHIARSSDDGEEKTELWLAADYHYLPLKFRKTEKDGTVLERIATHVQME